jgi:hypothetical protein
MSNGWKEWETRGVWSAQPFYVSLRWVPRAAGFLALIPA